MYYMPLFTSDHMCTNSLFSSDSSQCTIIDPTLKLIKILWFIHINTVFPLTFSVFFPIQNTFRKIKVMWVMISIMFRDQSIIMGFPRVPILQWCQLKYRSNRNFNIPPLLFKFPPTRTNMPFKCPILGSIQVIKQIPPSWGHLKTFHIIHYVGALKAESATVCNRQYSFYSNLFCNCFIIKKTNIKHTCSCQILIMNH